MPRRRHKPGEIVAKLRQVDVVVAQGTPLPRRSAGSVSARVSHERATGPSVMANDHRQRNGYGGLKLDRVKRLKELEQGEPLEAPLVRAQWRAPGCGRRSRT